MHNPNLERAILEAVAYSDIFEYPLRSVELLKYLPVRVGKEALDSALESMREHIEQKDDFYFLAGREEIINLRKAREARSQKLMPYAMRYGKILGSLPFVRMVALTGSLAVLNISKNADFDYMLVTSKGRVWTARLLAMIVNRFARLWGWTLCPNLIVAETALAWPLHDLYSARELHQMIPITGADLYRKLMKTNEWAREFLPNANLECGSLLPHRQRQAPALQKFTEFFLRGKLGDKLEHWEMTRKIKRFSKQAGFGEETIFTAEVCQGNFHHHRKWTREVFEEKLHVIARRAKPDEAIPITILEIASLPAERVARNDGARL